MTFLYRDTLAGAEGPVEVGFTDARLDLGDRAPDDVRESALRALADVTGCTPYPMHQVHGTDVQVVEEWRGEPGRARVDGLVTARAGIALLARVADCVPVLLADRTGLIGAVHAGRLGVRDGVVPLAVARLHALGAEAITAWVGPHICGGCYEVPAELQQEVADLEPATASTTSWGTPGLDIGAGVTAQLVRLGVQVQDISGCTLESDDLYSHRRDGAGAGRFAGLVRMRA